MTISFKKLIMLCILLFAGLALSTWQLIVSTTSLYEANKQLTMQATIIEQFKTQLDELTGKIDPIKQPEARTQLIEWTHRNSKYTSKRMAAIIVDEILKTQHPLLILALICAESEFNPTAVSKARAKGLGQIRFEVHRKALATLSITDPRDLFDIDKNIQATELLFMDMLRSNKGDVIKALNSYVGGTVAHYQFKVLRNFAEISMTIKTREI